MPDASGYILITSAGRRVQLVRCFQTAAAKRLRSGRVLVGESNPTWSAAAHIADGSFGLPPVTDASYASVLHELVRRERIALLVPTIDTELLSLSRMRESLGALGCTVVVSRPARSSTQKGDPGDSCGNTSGARVRRPWHPASSRGMPR